MKSVVYTYKNKKPVFTEVKRYHFVQNIAELDTLIGELLQIDAVSHPAYLKVPAILEVMPGFAITLAVVTPRDLRKQHTELGKLISRAATAASKLDRKGTTNASR